MSSLNGIMDTSLSAMFAARVGLATVNHNIANANTPGYSRQTVIYGTRNPLVQTYGVIGRGVQVDGIRRYTDTFLLSQHRSQAATLASHSQIDSTLQELEGIFGSVDNDHLGDTINQFFNAWSSLSNPQSEESAKVSVVNAAKSLVADFRSMSSSLDDLEDSIDDSLVGAISDLNDLLDQVSELNELVQAEEAAGGSANDVRDQRDYVLSQISGLTKIETIERNDGAVDVILNGRTVVTRDMVQHLESRMVPGDDGLELMVFVENTRSQLDLTEGSIQGLFDSRAVHVAETRASLDMIAEVIIDKVNELHVQGRSGSSSGRPFFTGDSAYTIDINSAITEDNTLVATSRSGLSGDNDIALEIAALPDASLSGEEGGATLRDRYRSVLIDLASNRSRFEFLLESQENVVVSIESRLEAVRGVSIDEEGAKMIQLQNTYNAAARVVTVVQEMFDSMLNMI